MIDDSAVVESRRIFKKLKSYVTYRFAATIQIVSVLTLFILISDCSIKSLYIILLALFNDLTMLPIAYDHQQAGSRPENPEVFKMLSVAASLGALETVMSLIFAYGVISKVRTTHRHYDMSNCNTQMQAVLWVQMFISAELLIFTTRASKYIVTSLRPSIPLTVSVLGGCLLVSFMAGGSSYFGAVPVGDILIVWLYDVLGLLLCDVLKVALFNFFEENTEVLPELVLHAPSHKELVEELVHSKPMTSMDNSAGPDVHVDHRMDHIVERLSHYADRNSMHVPTNKHSTDSSQSDLNSARSLSFPPNHGAPASHSFSYSYSLRDSLVEGSIHAIGMPDPSDMHPNILKGSIRPRVPANKKLL